MDHFNEYEEENGKLSISQEDIGRQDSRLEEVPFLDGEAPRPTNERRISKYYPKMNLSGVILLLLLVASSVALTVRYIKGSSNAPMSRPPYSPFYDHFQVPIITKQIDPYVVKNPDHPDRVFTKRPSPEVDAAWDRIVKSKVFIPLTEKEMRRMGKDPSVAVKIPDGMPGGGHYVGAEDNIYQIHCLNYLRKTLIHNYHYYWGETWKFSPPLSIQHHMDHCVEILRQQIMCNVGVELHTYEWREGEQAKWPNFEVRKTCKDFDAMLEWLEQHQRPDIADFWHNITMPEDAKKLPPPVVSLAAYSDNDTWINSAGVHLGPLPGLRGKDYCLG